MPIAINNRTIRLKTILVTRGFLLFCIFSFLIWQLILFRVVITHAKYHIHSSVIGL